MPQLLLNVDGRSSLWGMHLVLAAYLSNATWGDLQRWTAERYAQY